MANLQGLMGGPLLPEQTINPSSRDIQLNAVRNAASGVRNAVGGAAGFDARDPKERLMQELPKLDPTKTADQQQIVDLVSAVNPAKGMELKAQYANESATLAMKDAKNEKTATNRAAISAQFAGNPQLKHLVPLIDSGVYDADGTFKDVLPMLKANVKGDKQSKPFAGVTAEGKPVMLVTLSSEGANDKIIDVSTGEAPPVGTVLKTGSGTTVNVDLGEKANGFLMKELGKQRGQQIIDSSIDAKATSLSTQVIEDQWSLINSSEGILSGLGAESIKLPLSKLLMTAGMISKDAEKAVQNTEVFMANSGNLVAEVIKAFGAGTGLSDADREFAKGIVGGSIALTEEALKRLIKIQARASVRKIAMHNKEVGTLPKEAQEWGLTVDAPDLSWAFEEDSYDIANRKADLAAKRNTDWYKSVTGGTAATPTTPVARPSSVQAAMDKYKKGAK